MKKIILFLTLTSNFLTFAQEESKSIFSKKHEVKLGAVKLLAGPIFEGTYEYIHSKNFTYGGSLLINLQNDSDYYEDFSITPFARMYFQESKEYGAKGFFVEGFAKYTAGKNYIYVYNYDATYKKYSAAALGISLGKKWINSSGFVFELLGGVGRYIGGNNNTPDAVFRGDLFIGYRF